MLIQANTSAVDEKFPECCQFIAFLSYVRAAPARSAFVCGFQFGARQIKMRLLPALTETGRWKIDFSLRNVPLKIFSNFLCLYSVHGFYRKIVSSPHCFALYAVFSK